MFESVQHYHSNITIFCCIIFFPHHLASVVALSSVYYSRLVNGLHANEHRLVTVSMILHFFKGISFRFILSIVAQTLVQSYKVSAGLIFFFLISSNPCLLFFLLYISFCLSLAFLSILFHCRRAGKQREMSSPGIRRVRSFIRGTVQRR